VAIARFQPGGLLAPLLALSRRRKAPQRAASPPVEA
jgi:hypothetical protein